MSKKRKILTAVAVVLVLLVYSQNQDGIMGIYPTLIK